MWVLFECVYTMDMGCFSQATLLVLARKGMLFIQSVDRVHYIFTQRHILKIDKWPSFSLKCDKLVSSNKASDINIKCIL